MSIAQPYERHHWLFPTAAALPHYPLASKQQNMVERILNSGKHLLKLIDEILDFSQLEAGAMELKLEELNLAELVAISEMRSLVEQKNLTMLVNLNLHNPISSMTALVCGRS